MRLILYSKPGCHLCEGLQEKLEQIQSLKFDLEIRDITTCDDWFQQYQYEIPVLFVEGRQEAYPPTPQGTIEGSQESGVRSQGELTHSPIHSSTHLPLLPIPRPSPRASVAQLESLLQKYLQPEPKE